MRISTGVIGLVVLLLAGEAHAQSWLMNATSYALKAGETQELMDLYYITNCKSLLTGSPEVTILEGPPGVTVSVTDAMVLPRAQACARPIKGAKLALKVGAVEDQSQTMMTVRLRYPTKDGPRERSLTFSLALFPAD